MALACAGLLSVPSVAPALSEGRAYEMVSPLYKGGYGINQILAVAPDGESVAFKSQGAFSGALYDGLNGYLARRGSSGWSTSALEAPPTLVFPGGGEEPSDLSATLESTLLEGQPGPDLGAHSQTEDLFLLHHTGAPVEALDFEVVGERLKAVGNAPFDASYEGGSQDFSHVVFSTNGLEPLLPEAVGSTGRQLYDLVDGAGAGSLRLVGVNDSHKPIDPFCPVALGTNMGRGSTFNAIAGDGAEIFFTTAANSVEKTNCGVPKNPDLLYVRVSGEKTLQVSPSPASPGEDGPNAEFQGANEAGSCAFFTTSQPLVAGDTDASNDLYVARIGHAGETGGPCAPRGENAASSLEVSSLSQVSHDAHPGEAAEVQGVVAISPDGSRVYFVARGVLSEGANAEDRSAIAGADNLYVYETDNASFRSPVFVADLCSGAEASGGIRDASCPPSVSDLSETDVGLWLGGGTVGSTQTSADGRYLLFSTKAQLLAGDTDTARDLYRYDAITGELVRVTEGEAGHHANGNDSNFEATLPSESGLVAGKAGLTTRAINEAGTRIVFITAEPLSSSASNGLFNAYEWHREPGWSKAIVSLISSGSANEPVTDVLMSREGGDVFFITSQGLVPQDSDGAPDLYDARLGGGFPPPPAPQQACSGDSCQGGLSAPAPLLVPGSASQAPGGDFAPPKPATTVKKKTKSKKTKSKHKAKKKGKSKPKKARRSGRSARSAAGRGGR